MSIVQSQASKVRKPLVLLLLATTAAALSLGGCTRSGSEGPALVDNSVAGSAQANAAATSQWAALYAKKPQDAKLALGYARALRATGSKEQAMSVLQTAFQANPADGELAAEFGRLALDVGRLDIAQYTLRVAEAQGVNDWKTLSAQGTLRAKAGQHAEAQRYFLAALQQEPDSISVINNLALSYALDSKPDKAEDLLRKAVASGHNDKRVRQNLALVLGVQGKFDEARKVAAVDMPEADAKQSMAYLRSMLSSPTNVATLGNGEEDDGFETSSNGGWEPYADEKGSAPVRTAALVTNAIPARTVETKLPPMQQPTAKGDAQTPASTPSRPETTTTVAKTPPAPQPVAETSPQAATTKSDKLAAATPVETGTPAAAPAQTATLLRADIN
jgi:Flp pilus assembly protein TadD